MKAVYTEKNAGDHLFAEADVKYAMIKETLTSCNFQWKTEPEVERWLGPRAGINYPKTAGIDLASWT